MADAGEEVIMGSCLMSTVSVLQDEKSSEDLLGNNRNVTLLNYRFKKGSEGIFYVIYILPQFVKMAGIRRR